MFLEITLYLYYMYRDKLQKLKTSGNWIHCRNRYMPFWSLYYTLGHNKESLNTVKRWSRTLIDMENIKHEHVLFWLVKQSKLSLPLAWCLSFYLSRMQINSLTSKLKFEHELINTLIYSLLNQVFGYELTPFSTQFIFECFDEKLIWCNIRKKYGRMITEGPSRYKNITTVIFWFPNNTLKGIIA